MPKGGERHFLKAGEPPADLLPEAACLVPDYGPQDLSLGPENCGRAFLGEAAWRDAELSRANDAEDGRYGRASCNEP